MSAEIVIESWKHVTAIPEWQKVAGKILYTKIFTIAPEAYPLFSFSKDGLEMNSEEMFASPKFIKQYTATLQTVDAAVGMLGADLAPLVDILKKLGKRHVAYGVLEAHYPIVGQALIETLEAALGDKFTDDVKAAWVEIYGIISSTMIEGAAYEN